DRLAVLDDVGKDHHFGMPRLLIGAGDVDLERAEPLGKRLQPRRVEVLSWKAQHAVAPERCQDFGELRLVERPRQIEALDRGSERFAGWYYLHHSSPEPVDGRAWPGHPRTLRPVYG